VRLAFLTTLYQLGYIVSNETEVLLRVVCKDLEGGSQES